MSFFGPFFFLIKHVVLAFLSKKGANDGKKRETKKKLFFRISLFAGSDFWKRGARAKQDLGTAVITHSLFHLFGSAPIFPRGVFSRPPNPCRSPCLRPTPSTDEKRQLKDDKPGIPMIGSRVALAFHSGNRTPQNLFHCLYKKQNSKHFF